VDIKWVANAETGERFPIDRRITETTGPDRYRITEYGDEWKVELLDQNDRSSGHPDHRTRCSRA
jgi:hypothetical protein